MRQEESDKAASQVTTEQEKMNVDLDPNLRIPARGDRVRLRPGR